MLVLKEGATKCDGVVGAGVCAAAEAGGDAVDGKASLDLGRDDVTGGIVGRTEVVVIREAKGRRGQSSRGRREVASDGGNLCEGEVGAGEGDWLTRAVWKVSESGEVMRRVAH